jgi:hypothetical protein
MIHIGRAGTKLGSFSEDDVRRGLATGRFSLTDLGWKEGMENWAPLSTFPELTAPPEPEPPLPGETLPLEAQPAQPAPHSGLPWDERAQRGVLAAFAETARMVLTNPYLAFSRMLTDGSLLGPFIYNLIGGWLGLVASGIYLVLTVRAQPPSSAGETAFRQLFDLTPAMAMSELKFFAVMGPILVSVVALISSGIAHLFLMLAGGANKPYHVTLRVFCFSYGSAQLLQLLPICGSLVAPVWLIVCCVAGLAAAHETTTGRSVAAMALFMAACFACCIGFVLLAVGTSYQSLHGVLNH